MATKSPGYETGLRVYCIIKKILGLGAGLFYYLPVQVKFIV
jgi:hypothetical protein